MPGGLLTRRAVLLADIQAAEGTPATLNPSLHAILVSDLNRNPNGEQIERNFLRDSLSPLPFRMGRLLAEATFGFELRPAPELGARPEWSPLLRAAGMSETLTGATVTSIRTAALRWTLSVIGGAGVFWVELAAGGDPSITNPQAVRENGDDMRRASSLAALRLGEWWYGQGDTQGFSTIYVKTTDGVDPDSKAVDYFQRVSGCTGIVYDFRDTSHEFATVGTYRDGKLINYVDSLLDITSIQFNAGGVPTVQARMTADYTTPTDVALPTGLYQTHLPDIAENMLWTLDAFSTGVVPSWSINFGNQLSERRDVNSDNGFKGMRYVGRAPVGQATMEQELVAAFPAYTRYENATEMTWSAELGTVPRKITFSGPSVQITSIAETDINGIAGWNLGLRFNAPGSTKEFRIALT
jgi:hypothetical protein